MNVFVFPYCGAVSRHGTSHVCVPQFEGDVGNVIRLVQVDVVDRYLRSAINVVVRVHQQCVLRL